MNPITPSAAFTALILPLWRSVSTTLSKAKSNVSKLKYSLEYMCAFCRSLRKSARSLRCGLRERGISGTVFVWRIIKEDVIKTVPELFSGFRAYIKNRIFRRMRMLKRIIAAAMSAAIFAAGTAAAGSSSVPTVRPIKA